MQTERIFNAIYSDVSEDLKNSILDVALYEMGPETSYTMLTESYAEGLPEMLTDYVDLVAHNAVSEEALDEAIEYALNLVDTDTINLVAESFMDREVRRALFEREETINELFGFGKKSEERRNAEEMLGSYNRAARKSAADYKSALASQKANLKAMKSNSPIGLAGLKRDAATKHSDEVAVGKAKKKAEQMANIANIAKKDLSDIKAKERREAIDKVKGAAKSVWNKFTGAVKKGAEAVKNKAVETKDKAVSAVKTGAEKVKSGVETAKAKAAEVGTKVSDATKTAVAKGASAVAKGATKVADAANKVQAKAEGSTSKATKKAALLNQQKIHQENLKDKGLSRKQLAYQQKRLDAVNAELAALGEGALAEFTSILASSNISEEAFDEVMEKLNTLRITPEGVAKAKAKAEAEVNKDLGAMEKTMEQGRPVTPEQTQKAEKSGAKLEKIRARFKEARENTTL